MAAAPLPSLALQPDTNADTINAIDITTSWLHSLTNIIENQDWSAVHDLFVTECWWKDVIALTWDFATKNGPNSVSEYLAGSSHGLSDLKPSTGVLSPKLTAAMGGHFIESGFSFRTKFGSGRGILRLVNTAKDEWKAWIVYTNLEHLDMPVVEPAPTGEGPLQVLVVGAGHSGLTFAASLKQLGLRHRIVDTNKRIGDNWRLRYESMRAHTPSWHDRFPFLDFPSPWPVYMTGKEIGDWQEHYAQQLEINVELETTMKSAHFDHARKVYEVELSGPRGTEKLTVKHVVLALGPQSSEPRPLDLPGHKLFQGECYHTSQHKSASYVNNVSQKTVVVIGTGTSAHDVAQDFVEHGAKEVTMLQRGSIYSLSPKAVIDILIGPYRIPGITIEEADLLNGCTPFRVFRTLGPHVTRAMQAIDDEMLQGLRKAGLEVKPADDNGESFATQFLIKLGGTYIDQGANQMITDGRIRIVRDENGVVEFDEQGVILGGGKRVAADIIVKATGYQNSLRSVEKLMDPEVVQLVGDVGGIDHEGDRIGWCRPTGFPNFWYMGGDFNTARKFGKTLAFLIQTVEDGRNSDYYESMERKGPELRRRVA